MGIASVEHLIEKIKSYNPNCNEQRITEAFELAKNAHESQKRRSGTPYITHPLAVAEIVADMKRASGRRSYRLQRRLRPN